MSLAVTLISAYLSDRYHTRAIPTMVIGTFAVAGFGIYLGRESPSIKMPGKPE